MRLHHLSMTAFGPFADTAVVDFDALSEAGLFLLSGPNGAGKSSILDGVCFALFGAVAGDRNQAGDFHSDHAETDAAPIVELEATIGERRVRIRRSPAWQRPKRRGHGLTTQQAGVLVQERRDGQWVTHTTRLDEAGDLVTTWLGVNKDQFLQVAMLPQGGFQKFLTAPAKERKNLLEKLFRTTNYQAIEQAFAEHRRQSGRAVFGLRSRVDQALARFGEAAGVEVPSDLTQNSHSWLISGSMEQWATTVCQDLRSTHVSATQAAEAAGEQWQAARSAHQAAMALSSLQQRGLAARAERDRLAANEPAMAAQRIALDSARAAAPVMGLITLWRQARDSLQHSRQTCEQAVAAARTMIEGELSTDSLRAAHQQAIQRAALARDFVPSEARLRELTSGLIDLADQDERLRERQTHFAELLAAAPEQIARARARVDHLNVLAAEHDGLLAITQALTERREVIADIARLDQVIESQEGLVGRLSLAYQESRERLVGVREARVAGMAAELATSLAVGCSCPVCGSADHPHPATRSAMQVDEGAEAEAQRECDEASLAVQLAREELRGVQAQRAALIERAGEDHSGALDGQLLDAHDQLRAAASASAELPEAAQSLQAAEARFDDLTHAHADVTQRLSALAQQIATSTGEAGALEQRLATLLASGDAHDLSGLIEEHKARASAMSALIEAHSARQRAQVAFDSLTDQATQAAQQAGFADLEAAQEAAVSEEARAHMQAALSEFDAAIAAAQAIIDEPDVVLALAQEPPDLGALALHEDAASERASAATARATATERAARRSRDLLAELSDVTDQFRPAHADYERAVELAAIAEGKGPDNEARISLSAYVLAQRLRHVVEAANERLGPMIDYRYRLEHTEDRRGDRQGGLSLNVVDEWTDAVRAPTTLSGGESFVVSLSLALGLADVATREAGGVEIGTLFVDEGFGSLDSETLEQVMEGLDALRSGGRVVGVVSHVPLMRDRIPTRLDVVKARHGSTVRLVTGHAT